MSELNPIRQYIFGIGTPRLILVLARPSGWIEYNTEDDGDYLTVKTCLPHKLIKHQKIRFVIESDTGQLTGDVDVLSIVTDKIFTCHIDLADADTGGFFEALTDIYESNDNTTYDDRYVYEILADGIDFNPIRAGHKISSNRILNGLSYPTFAKVIGKHPDMSRELATAGKLPRSGALDGDGNLWIANSGDNSVTKITPTGATTKYSGTGLKPVAIAYDGVNMWTANYLGNSVTKITPAGVMTTYSGTGNTPNGIAFDGANMWTCNIIANSVSKITSAGVITSYSGTGNGPFAITFDGTNLWTANVYAKGVSKITTTGTITNYTGTGTQPSSIAYYDNAVWTCSNIDATVTKVLISDGSMTTYGNTGHWPADIIYDSATGCLWTVNLDTSKRLSKINPSTGLISNYDVRISQFNYAIISGNSKLYVVGEDSVIWEINPNGSIEVDGWSNGIPTNGEKFRIDGWVCDLPRCQDMTEIYEPDVLIHSLYGGDAGSIKETEFYGWIYTCILDYSGYASSDLIHSLKHILELGRGDRLIIIPRRDKSKRQFNVFFGDKFELSIAKRTPGYQKPIFVFSGKENIHNFGLSEGYGTGYGEYYGSHGW